MFELTRFHCIILQAFTCLKDFIEPKGWLWNVSSSCWHTQIYPEICLQLHFIRENCHRLMTALTSLEARETALACTVFNSLEDLRAHVSAGTSKTSFGQKTDELLSKLPADKRNHIKSFQTVFAKSLSKLEDHLDRHPAFYKAVRVFDPRQLPALVNDIADFAVISGLQDPSPELLEEWLIYTDTEMNYPAHFPSLDFGRG